MYKHSNKFLNFFKPTYYLSTKRIKQNSNDIDNQIIIFAITKNLFDIFFLHTTTQSKFSINRNQINFYKTLQNFFLI